MEKITQKGGGAKGLSIHFSREQMKIVSSMNKKNYSTSLVRREITFHTLRMTVIKKEKDRFGEGVEIVYGTVKWCHHCGRVWQVLRY